jgi:hypothetical protein
VLVIASNFADGALNTWCAAYPEFAEDFHDVFDYSDSKPDFALLRLRQVLETILKRAYTHFTRQPLPEKSSILDLLDDSQIIAQVPESIWHAMDSVRKTGNRAVHRKDVTSNEMRVTSNDVAREIESMDHILRWAAASSGRDIFPTYESNTTTSARIRPSRLGSHASTRRTPLVVGVTLVLIVLALVWLYLRNLNGMLNEQQRAWLQRRQSSASSKATATFKDPSSLHDAAVSNDAVILTHPSPPQANEQRSGTTSMDSGSAYPRNYPSSWPAPFFQEEIRPGEWGTWLEEPGWQEHSGEQDFIWYRTVEMGGVEERNEWSVQCEDGQGTVRYVGAGHNEECKMSRRIRIRNDWQYGAVAYYFAKRLSPK